MLASVVVAHEPSCPVACGIFLCQGPKLCPLYWLADFLNRWTTREVHKSLSVSPISWLQEIGFIQASMTFAEFQFSSVHSVVSNSLRPHGLQHAKLACPSPTAGDYSNSCPLSWWRHPTISSSVIPFYSCLQSFPASGSFPMSQFFPSGGQSIGVSASVLPVNIQDQFPLGWTGWISLLSKRLSRVFSNTTVLKHKFFGTKLSL